MATTTPTGLAGLAGQVPVANAQLAAQQKAARDLQLQAAVKAAPAATSTAALAPQIGTALATQAGAQQVAGVQQAAQATGAVEQLGQQVQQLQNQQAATDQKAGLAEQQISDVQTLASISEDAKKEMYDSRRAFSQDQLGQKFTNERQLADYAKLRARTDDEFADYTQKTEQLYKRKSQLLESAQSVLEQKLVQDNAELDQLRTHISTRNISEKERAASTEIYQQKLEQRQRLSQAKAALARSIARDKADRANRLAKNGSIGTILGAAAGAAIGTLVAPGVGTMAGASAGASLGGGVGTLTSPK